MKSGVLSSVLVEQVRNTAAWLWHDARYRALTAVFDAARDEAFEDAGALLRAFRVRLAAHYATVATFVPTDVDAHIRHHVWMAVADAETFVQARACTDEAAARDPGIVSERVTHDVSGHDGEWLSVRAGALGRALALGLDSEADSLAEQIDVELERQHRLFVTLIEGGAPATTTLALATTIAHNLGDLSRVVDAWPRSAGMAQFQLRYSRLGHADGPGSGRGFLIAGTLNKELMAIENHRFLALRKPRALRRSRTLLLPIGPWFDAWGETVCGGNLLDESERAEVVAALLELHLRSPGQQGCLRALAGMHRATRGGLSSYGSSLPARLRKELGRGHVREAIDVSRERFEGRLENRARALIARLTGAERRPRRGNP